MVSTPIGPVIPPDMSQMSKSTNNQPYLPPVNQIPYPVIPNSTAPLLQPTLQPGMPYMPNLFVPAGLQHTFPVLYNQQPVVPATTPPTEVQPTSLYAEYMGNPYNVTPAENFNGSEQENGMNQHNSEERQPETTSDRCITSNLNDNDVGSTGRVGMDNNNVNIDRVANNNGVATSYFQSSNYFNSQVETSIPPGSEILYASHSVNASDVYTGSKISDI